MTPAAAVPIIEIGGNERPEGSVADLIAWLATQKAEAQGALRKP